MRLTPEQLAGDCTLAWRKSTRSGAAGHCVEVALVAGTVAVRNSNHRGDGGTGFTRAEWSAFLEGVKAGEFDDLAQ